MRIRSSIICLALCLNSMAQVESSFPDSNAVWSNVNVSYSLNGGYFPDYGSGSVTTFKMSAADTLINGLSYSIITHQDSNYVGAVRTVGERVLFVLHDQLEEYTLYDFSGEVGDTISNVIYFQDGDQIFNSDNFQLASHIVGYVDSVMYDDGILRKTLWMYSDESGSESEWVEGIGNTKALFWWAGENVSDYIVGLGRFCQDGNVVFQQYVGPYFFQDTGDCTGALVTGIEDHQIPSFNISPNPTSGLFTLTSSTPISTNSVNSIAISDSFGRTIAIHDRSDFEDPQYLSFDLSSHPTGVYLITWISPEGVTTQLLVKE